MIQSIKMNDHKIQDMGAENVYIKKSHEECHFFFKNKHDYKCDIDFIQQLNKQ